MWVIITAVGEIEIIEILHIVRRENTARSERWIKPALKWEARKEDAVKEIEN